jgi:aldose 1-epimerase
MLQKASGALPVVKSVFGHLRDGTVVDRIVLLHPRSGLAVEILEYGATIRSIVVPDKRGRMINTVLSYPSLREYELGDAYLGATIGRCAGRTGVQEHSKWRLSCNEGANHLHGGKTGFSHSLWRTIELDETDTPRVRLRHHSPAGEDGYPGNLVVDAEFSLVSPLTLQVVMQAQTDSATPINLTLHPYFNLNSDPATTIHNHKLQIAADTFLRLGDMRLPTGQPLGVHATPFDFREPVPIGAHIDDAHEQLRLAGGYDHYWILNDGAAVAADIYSPTSAVGLRVSTNQKGVQFYAGNKLHIAASRPFLARSGFCIEPHAFPNAMNEPGFPDITLQAGESYTYRTSYMFYTR